VKLPVTVQAVLAARIDRLAAEHKRILQSAAVIGARVPFQLLHAITGLGEEPLRAGLRQLAAAAFLREQRLFPDVEYAFTQALTHEVAYRSLLQARRRELHARIVEVIEGRAGEGLLEHAEILAHHAARAELWSKAVAYARQAGAKAAARSATREAVAALDQALAALARLPESRETIELGIDVRFELQSALIPVDDLARMLDCLREAEQLAEAIGDQRRLGRVWAHMSYCCTWKGESVRAVEHGERALALAAATADRDLELLAQFHLGRALFAVGDLRRAIGAFAATAAALTGERLHERLGMPAFPAVTARSLTALCRASLGEFPAARQAAIEGLRLAQAAEHPFSLAVAQWGLGLVHLLGGEAPDAVTWLGHSVELCRARGFTNLALLAGAPLAHACALTGKIADALALLAEMAPPPGSVNTASRAANVARAAEVYLRAGRAAEAAAAARRALELSRAHGQQAGVANALRVLGDVHAASAVPDVGAAETAYREARDLGERLGLRPLIAHCHRGLGLLHLRCGDRARADEHLGAAAALYRELGMRAWLEPPLPTATNPRP
jgi:tetratricopeptide (TPR) repeat protein